jgi:hypothetical protein
MAVRYTGMKLLNEVFKSVKKKNNKKKQKQKNKKTKIKKTQTISKKTFASWSLTLTWLVGFKPTRDRVLLLTNQAYHS